MIIHSFEGIKTCVGHIQKFTINIIPFQIKSPKEFKIERFSIIQKEIFLVQPSHTEFETHLRLNTHISPFIYFFENIKIYNIINIIHNFYSFHLIYYIYYYIYLKLSLFLANSSTVDFFL